MSSSRQPPRSPLPRLAQAGGALPGAVIAASLGAAALLRRDKPVHPTGRVGQGWLEVTSPQEQTGVPVLAESGRHACTVRYSRTLGLPAPLPDVEGLAIRFDEHQADVLLAATGVGPVGRFVFRARRPDRHGPMTTHLPVATQGGSLLLRVEPLDQSDPPEEWALSVAGATQSWRPVGTLRVAWGDDRSLRFDPVENLLPGTWQYPVVTTLREPAYRLARRLAKRPKG